MFVTGVIVVGCTFVLFLHFVPHCILFTFYVNSDCLYIQLSGHNKRNVIFCLFVHLYIDN